MRHFSPKRARLNRQAKPLREAYRSEFPICQVLGCKLPAKELHEIARGNGIRSKAILERAAWLNLCRDHHRELGDYSAWPVVRQLALKQLVDPLGYDRVIVNVLRGWAPESITEAEVDAECVRLRAAESQKYCDQLPSSTAVGYS